jgi:hypothetical protein
MHLDHVSYVASHDQISDVVNRIGSQIGTAFIDGGIHPKFGTRNFTAPLLNNQYIEIVCPMDHPATDASPFGMAVKKKLQEGGGWFTWVFALESVEQVENQLKRKSIEGRRKKPDGTELVWKQIGVLATLENTEFPFFIEWLTKEHPSTTGIPKAKLSKINITGNSKSLFEWCGFEIENYLETNQLVWQEISSNQKNIGITKIDFVVNDQIVSIT